jgi:predicted HNH restriction endonuclease
MGISSEEIVSTSGLSAKQKQMRKEVLSLKKLVEQLEEEKLELKMKLHKQKRLSVQSQETPKSDSNKTQDQDGSMKNQIKSLVEENEALRRGMHEILDSLNTRKGNCHMSLLVQRLAREMRRRENERVSVRQGYS